MKIWFNKAFDHFVGLFTGVVLLWLGSFVPKLYIEVTNLLNQGTEVGLKGGIVLFFLAALGAAMFYTGHIFRAYNKRVAKHFDEWFKI
jgi:hypothetical protein